jgi:hypothetical protein
MSAVEPLFSHHSATDVLKNLFSPPNNQSVGDLKDTDSLGSPSHAHAEISFPEALTEPELAQAEAKEISAEPNDNVQIDHFITQPDEEDSDDNEPVTKSELVKVLETFVSLMRESKEKVDEDVHINLPSRLPKEYQPTPAEEIGEIIDAKDAEIDDLKNLLVEAQSTIITLLTDRVEDKAKLATLEAQMRYLPDYQRMQTPPSEAPASAASLDADDLRADLTKVKAELLTIKNTAFKAGFDKTAKWSFKSWLAKFVGSE